MIVKMGYMLQKEERRMGGGNVSQDQTSIICIDLKSFYASVECVERGLNPFKTNLVVADPTRSKSTICLAITPAMKSLDIKNRCRIHEIPELCEVHHSHAKDAAVYGLFRKDLWNLSAVRLKRDIPCVQCR